jgi:hypothetical protein
MELINTDYVNIQLLKRCDTRHYYSYRASNNLKKLFNYLKVHPATSSIRIEEEQDQIHWDIYPDLLNTLDFSDFQFHKKDLLEIRAFKSNINLKKININTHYKISFNKFEICSRNKNIMFVEPPQCLKDFFGKFKILFYN